MKKDNITRRDFLKIASVSTAGFALSACGVDVTNMPTKTPTSSTNFEIFYYSIRDYFRSENILSESAELDEQRFQAIDTFACGFSASWFLEVTQPPADREKALYALGGIGQRLYQHLTTHDQPSILFETYQTVNESTTQKLALVGVMGVRFSSWLSENKNIPFGNAECMEIITKQAYKRIIEQDSLNSYLSGITPDTFVETLLYELEDKAKEIGVNFLEAIE